MLLGIAERPDFRLADARQWTASKKRTR